MNCSFPRILLISIALAVLLVGCGGAQEPATSKTALPASQTLIPPGSPTPIPTAEPLPADIVVYPGAQLVVAQRITIGTLYSYRSTATLDAVTIFYIDQMPLNGWKQASSDLNGAQGNLLVYIKDTRSVMLSIVSDLITPTQTDINITLSNS